MDAILKWFEDFSEWTPATTLTIGILIGLFIGLFIGLKSKSTRMKWNARMLSHASLMIALGFLLSYIKFYHWPQGGSITPASMLPVMAFSYMYGTPYGLVAGFAYSLLQIIQDPFIIHPIQLLLDYPLAFTAIGLAGVARNIRMPESISHLKLSIGVIIAGLARTLFSVISGVVFFWEYAPPEQSVIWYSISVNLTVIGIDTLICAIIAAIPAMSKLFPMRQDTMDTIKAA